MEKTTEKLMDTITQQTETIKKLEQRVTDLEKGPIYMFTEDEDNLQYFTGGTSMKCFLHEQYDRFGFLFGDPINEDDDYSGYWMHWYDSMVGLIPFYQFLKYNGYKVTVLMDEPYPHPFVIMTNKKYK